MELLLRIKYYNRPVNVESYSTPNVWQQNWTSGWKAHTGSVSYAVLTDTISDSIKCSCVYITCMGFEQVQPSLSGKKEGGNTRDFGLQS